MAIPRLLVALLAASTALAGCTDDDPVQEPPTPTVADGPGAAPGLTRDGEAAAPQWSVGDWFGHHVYFGDEDTEGSHINTVVVEDSGSDYVMVADDPQVAKWEAVWDFPMLGTIGKADLATTAFTADWNIYRFPMRHGDSWSTTVNPLFAGPRELTLTAAFNSNISTPYGVFPGFDITGVNATGGAELETDFVPEIGWYSRLLYLDPSTQDPDDFILDIRSMGRGANWTGTYYVDEARELVNDFGLFTPLDPASAQAVAGHDSFTVSGDGYEVYGIVFSLAGTGTARVDLVDPNHEHHAYEISHADGNLEGANALFEFVELPATAGDWNLFRANAGLFALAFVQLWEVVEQEFTFGQ